MNDINVLSFEPLLVVKDGKKYVGFRESRFVSYDEMSAETNDWFEYDFKSFLSWPSYRPPLTMLVPEEFNKEEI